MILWKELVSERLVLRELRDADEGPIMLYAGDRRVAWMTAPIPHPYPPGAAAAYIASARAGKPQLVWGLDATPSGGSDFLGVIGFQPETQTIGYWIGPPFWRQGYATEATTALSKHLLAQGIQSIHATAMTENLPSQKVLERAGFLRTGTGMSYSIARGCEVEVVAFEKTRGLTGVAAQAKDGP